MKLNGAQLTVQLLERLGVEVIAGVPGGAILPIYDALSQSSRIRHVLARHEQGAGFIAQGMARVTGKPGVCMASSGPGVTNLLTAIADAKLDSIPLLAITGQVPRRLIGTDAFQEVDAYGLSVPITKHNFFVNSARELLDLLPRAFAIAAAGRPGPVLIDIPKDVQTEIVEVEAWPVRESRHSSPPPMAGMSSSREQRLELAASDPISQAAKYINSAQRPLLYLGGGVIHSPGAAELAQQLAETAELPTVMTLMALGALPVDHRLSLGMLGMHAARYTNLALERCDLLIAAGARFDDRATGKVAQFCPQARILHFDIDAAELNKIKTACVGVAGDLGATLRALLPLIERSSRAEWLAEVAALKARFPLLMPDLDKPRSHYGLIRAVAECLDDSALITTDVGQHQMWVAQSYPLRRPRQWLTSGGLGTMGFGLPAAIGAALAAPERTVVCFSGDGSLLMNIQELATAAEEQVNVKIVLLNNGSLGLVHQQQQMFYEGRVYASKFRAQTDFCGLAASFGMDSVDLDHSRDVRGALRRALRAPAPCLIHAGIDANHHVVPMVPAGAANRDMIGGLA